MHTTSYELVVFNTKILLLLSLRAEPKHEANYPHRSRNLIFQALSLLIFPFREIAKASFMPAPASAPK